MPIGCHGLGLGGRAPVCEPVIEGAPSRRRPRPLPAVMESADKWIAKHLIAACAEEKPPHGDSSTKNLVSDMSDQKRMACFRPAAAGGILRPRWRRSPRAPGGAGIADH